MALQQSEQASAEIGVVLVNFASSRLIQASLGSIELAHAKVIVVDNFSDATERVAIRSLCVRHGWSLVEMAGNPGFGGGVNAGVARAEHLGCACFLLLNPDATITGETVDSLRTAALGDPLALFAPRLVDSDGGREVAGTTVNLVDGRMRSLRAVLAHPDPGARPVTWLTAACLAFHGELWRRSGGFDEDYFMYWEDVDFTFRCLCQGGRVVVRDDLSAVHDQGGTQGPRRGRSKSALYYYYNCRNRMMFAVKHLDRAAVMRWWVKTPRVSWEVLLRGGRRQLLSQPRLAWSAASGGLAGMGRSAVSVLVPRPVRRRYVKRSRTTAGP